VTVVCLGYRAGFVEAARRRGLDLHFVVDKVKPGLRDQSRGLDLHFVVDKVKPGLRDQS